MIRAFFSALFYGGVVLGALYLVTGVSIGRYTLVEHVARIFETEEARELTDGVEHVRQKVEKGVREVESFAD